MNKRRFSLIARDLDWNDISSFSFEAIGVGTSFGPRVYGPNGFGGFEQTITVQEGEVVDYVVKQSIRKGDITLNVGFPGSSPLEAVNSFRLWIATYIDALYYRVCLMIEETGLDGSPIAEARYIDVLAKKLVPSEISGGVATATLTLQPISLPYTRSSSRLIMNGSGTAKSYPYGYPYSYGIGSYGGDNAIRNAFMKKVPLILRLTGRIVSPEVSLFKAGSAEAYSTVSFSGITLEEGYTLRVDAVNERIVLISPNGSADDYYNYTDKSLDSFLYAEPGESTIEVNIDPNEAKASLSYQMIAYTI